MKHKTIFLLLFALLAFQLKVRADQWRDPSWREMIDSSDAIALIRYTSNGMYRAQAQVLTVYKGNLKAGSLVWISGFSNHYGPYDSVSRGETFLVFLNANHLSESGKAYWEEQVKDDPDLTSYYTALKNKTAFGVWTPTAGDLRVKAGRVQYDLLQTSYYTKERYYTLTSFETFLRYAIAGKAPIAFYQSLLIQASRGAQAEQTSQCLMMLCLTRYKEYNPLYERLTKYPNPSVRFALAQFLGNVKSERSRTLLIQLLDDKNSFVQGEAVRQLSTEPKEIVGPIFVRKLATAKKGVAGPSDIMNPLLNTINGGQVEIINTLEKLHYTDAVPTLLPLLETNDKYTFQLVLKTLQSLGYKAYAPYLIKHLNEGPNDLLFTISTTVENDSLTECLPALMNYITTHDRTKHPAVEYLVSYYSGIGHFTGDSVKRFLVKDFLSILHKDLSQSGIDNKRKWVEQYIETFTQLGIDTLKSYLYDFLYEYYGLSHRFKLQPTLFAEKKRQEDSLITIVRTALPKDSIEEIKAEVFLLLTPTHPPSIADYIVQYKAKAGVSLQHMTQLVEKSGIERKHLIASVGSTSYSNGSRWRLSFDEGILRKFLLYLAAFPDKADVAFMDNLAAYEYPETDYDKRRLREYQETAMKNLK